MPARKFMKGIVYGALVGGALTLLDRDVRKQLITDSKNR